MPENLNSVHLSKKLTQITGVKKVSSFQDKLNKKQEMSYNWNTQKNNEGSSENVNDIISNLLEKKLISDDSSGLLKKENQAPYNPVFVMDLRHEMVKIRNQQKKFLKTESGESESKRLILHEEIEKIAIENELLIIDKEIDSFKKQLELNKKRFSSRIKGTQLSMYKRIRLNRNKQKAACNKTYISRLPLPSKSILKTDDSFPNIHMKQENKIFKHLRSDNLITNESTGKVQIKSLSNISNSSKLKNIGMLPSKIARDDKANKEEEGGEMLKEEEKFLKTDQLNRGCLYNKQYLIHDVLNKWKRYTLNKKILKAASKMEDKRNRTLLKKCWNIWKEMVKEKRRIVAAVKEKCKTDQKIDKFLKILQEQKQALVAPALMKDLENINKINERTSNCFPQSSQSKTVRTKKQTTENYGRFQSKSAPSQLSIKYQNRFETQQSIIENQKCKLQEQSKLIKELQLQQLKFQTEKSTKQAYEEINQTLINCDLSLKPKVRQVQARLSTANGRLETSERKCTIKSLRISPPILTKMEERAQEREKRWQMIKERKLKRIKEKERQGKEEEEQRKRTEEYEKRQKIEELKEKRRIEKEIELQRQKEKEWMIGLRIKAIHYYKRKLLKNAIKAMHHLVLLRKQQRITSEKHYKVKLLHNSLHAWRQNVQSIHHWKIKRATLLHNKQLMRKAFFGFLKVHNEYVVKHQVAIDFYDFHLQEHVFISWHQVTCTAYMETIYKLGQASVHFNRTLLRRYIKQWEKLPFVMRLEREKEKRKQILRMKVQEMLPDYKPMFSMFDHDSFTY